MRTSSITPSLDSSDFFDIPTLEGVSEEDRSRDIQGLAGYVSAFLDRKARVYGNDGLVVVMPEGYGKSFLAFHLVAHNFKVVICCKSNAQVVAKAEEIAGRWPKAQVVKKLLERQRIPSLSVARYVSSEQNLTEALHAVGITTSDFKLINYPSTSPYSPPTVDEPSSLAALSDVFRHKGIQADPISFFSEHYTEHRAIEVDARSKHIVLMTLAAFQALSTGRETWWRRLGLVQSRRVNVTHENRYSLCRRLRDDALVDGDQVTIEVPYERVAVVIDDPDRSDVDWLRYVSKDSAEALTQVRVNQARLPMARKRQETVAYWKGLGAEANARAEQVRRENLDPLGYPVHRVIPYKNSFYVERPVEQMLGHRLKVGRASPKIIVTTTEYLTGYYALTTLRRSGLRVEDELNLFHTNRCNVTAIPTTITRKKNHALLLPIVALLKREFPRENVTLIADGLRTEFNLSNNKGRNDLTDRTTIIKLSWSHPTVTATVGAHFPSATNTDLVQGTLLADGANQALGRTQGFRFDGRLSVLLIDPRWYPTLIANRLIRYRLNPWSESLPILNKRLSQRARKGLVFEQQHGQTALERRLLELLAQAEDFGYSPLATEVMEDRPIAEQEVFASWLGSASDLPTEEEIERAKAHRKQQVREAVRRHRAKNRLESKASR